MKSVIVLGAGYAGCTAAALLAAEGADVTVLERHNTLGGCASFFKEGKFLFDVGATTISGLRKDQPAGRVFHHLGIQPNVIHQDPGMIVRMHHADVYRWANEERWIEEAERCFGGNQRKFWKAQNRRAHRVWKLVGATSRIPPRSVADVMHALRNGALSWLPLLPGLVRSVESTMPSAERNNAVFREFLNEQLLISAQNTAEFAPSITGALGLTYPAETYYPIGGMVQPALQLMRKAQQSGAEFRFRRVATTIRQNGNGWQVICANGEIFTADCVVSSVPIWNMASLTQGSVQRYMQKLSKRNSSAWCAFTVYFALQGRPQLPSAYMQVFLDEEIPFVHSGSLFLTVSQPQDTQKAPSGYCTVTVSTHTVADDWLNCSVEEQVRRKQRVTQAIMDTIERRVPEFAGMERVHIESGTPATWQKYTGRYHGFVGGIPHSIRKPLLFLPPNQTPFRGLYMIGDSVFPGQGTPAVMLGAWNTVDRIFAQ